MSALGAFLKTVEIIRRDNVIEHIWTYGKNLMDGLNSIAREYGIEKNFIVEGYSCSPNYVTRDREGNASFAFRTLFAQEMIKSGVMMPYISLSFSHGSTELDITLSAAKKALNVYAQALEQGIGTRLHSRVIKPVFRKYN